MGNNVAYKWLIPGGREKDCILFRFSLARPAKEELAVFQNCVLVCSKKLCLWGSVPVRSPTRSLVCVLLEEKFCFSSNG